MTAKILTDIIGAKYYKHNEEINISRHTDVRVFDEDDTSLGIMSLKDALGLAKSTDRDCVLRNIRTDPPIIKVMAYRKELMKKLFTKLGQDYSEFDEGKPKIIKFSASITQHDLENKKRQAMRFLKKNSILKFYVKVNSYDAENIQKGRMVLLNLAEDLKDVALVKVSPMKDKKKAK